MFTQVLRSVVLLTGIGLPVWTLFRLAARRRRSVDWPRELLLGTLFIYILAVTAMTLVPMRWTVNGEPNLNLIPIVDLVRNIQRPGAPPEATLFHTEMALGNLLLLAPLGLLLPMLWRRCRRVAIVMASALAVSVSIEALQYLLQFLGSFRTADIDDVIFNTLGAYLGFLIWRAATKLPIMTRFEVEEPA